jgi:ankyrin repeat protein
LLAAVSAYAAAGDAPLVDAVKEGDARKVTTLLEQRANVNASEVDGTTALHWAVHRDDTQIVDRLLRAGANVNAENRYGVKPIMLAAVNGHAAIIESLLEAGADVNTANAEGQTVLMTAARTGKPEAVRVLLARGARVNATERYRGQSALMWAAAQGQTDTVRMLVEAGADISARSKGNPSAVRAAVRSNVSQLAISSLDPTATGNREEVPNTADQGGTAGLNALLFAVRAGHIETARALIDAGANVNDTVGDGTSALVLAVMNANYALAAMLLEKGANPNADAQGWTALHQLVWTRSPNLMRPTPFPLTSGTLSALDLVKVLVAHGANVNARQRQEPNDGNRNTLNRIGATPFLLAAKAADVGMMQALVAAGADPLLKTNEGATPIMVAAGIGIWRVGESVGTNEEALAAVRLAWELGNDVNAVDTNGDTAMHGAVHRGAPDIVQFLIEKGADPDRVNLFGWTPLTIASGVWYPNTYKSEPETGAVLRKLGARNPGKRRPEDYPPTELAAPLDPDKVSTTTNGTFAGRARQPQETEPQQTPGAQPPQGTPQPPPR